MALLLMLVAVAAIAGAAYVAGVFEAAPDPTRPALVLPTSTPEERQAPTIAAVETPTDDIDTPTDAAETPTDVVETPTPPQDDDPGIIVSAVPDTSPSVIEPVEGDS
jgi:hypothetical protein